MALLIGARRRRNKDPGLLQKMQRQIVESKMVHVLEYVDIDLNIIRDGMKKLQIPPQRALKSKQKIHWDLLKNSTQQIPIFQAYHLVAKDPTEEKRDSGNSSEQDSSEEEADCDPPRRIIGYELNLKVIQESMKKMCGNFQDKTLADHWALFLKISLTSTCTIILEKE